MARVFAKLAEGGEGYLFAQKPSPGLIRALASTLADVRLAGLSAKQLAVKHFEVEVKGRELAALLAAYEEELQASGQVDYAGVLLLAAARVRREPGAIPEGVRVLLPAEMARDFSRLERGLWEAIPEGRRGMLEGAGFAGEEAKRRRGEEAEVAVPPAAGTQVEIAPFSAALRPAAENSADLRHKAIAAVGEVNEVREVVGRCAASGWAWDDVEILYTDAETYLPLLYEFASRLWAEEKRLPITFAEGIPARYARPARALLGWLAWRREGFSQTALARLVQDGLLVIPGQEAAGYSFARLAALLRGLPIGWGRERYARVLTRELEAVARRLTSVYEVEGLEDPSGYARVQREYRTGVKLLEGVVTALLAEAPEEEERPQALLAAATSFLTQHARATSEFDEYSRSRLLSEIRGLQECLGEGEAPGIEVGAWLAELVQGLRVDALGPRPGCLYAAPFAQGGHSGRSHTFLLGLDDGRFPGGGTQDPLLLDGERSRLSRELPTAASRLSRRVQELSRFARTCARGDHVELLQPGRARGPGDVPFTGGELALRGGGFVRAGGGGAVPGRFGVVVVAAVRGGDGDGAGDGSGGVLPAFGTWVSRRGVSERAIGSPSTTAMYRRRGRRPIRRAMPR